MARELLYGMCYSSSRSSSSQIIERLAGSRYCRPTRKFDRSDRIHSMCSEVSKLQRAWPSGDCGQQVGAACNGTGIDPDREPRVGYVSTRWEAEDPPAFNESDKFDVGDKVMAERYQEGVWYNAKIVKVIEPGTPEVLGSCNNVDCDEYPYA